MKFINAISRFFHGPNLGILCVALIFTGPGTMSLQFMADKLGSGNSAEKKKD